MATRKSLVLISGLTQELNSSSDKLDFAGNSTSDLSEGTNQYFTNARSRGALSVASGSGLTYNSTSGELSTSAIPNAQLANSALTIGGTSVSLGATQTTFTGLSSLASTTLIAGTEDAANSIEIGGGNITFEGSTADGNETILTATDATGGDKTITLPNNSGTVALTSDIVYPVTLTNTVTLTNKTLALGSNTISGTLAQFNTAVTDATLVSTTGSETLTNKSVNLANNTLTGTFAQFNTAVSNATLVSTTGTETLTNKSLTAPVLTGSSASAGSIIFREDTDNGTNSVTLKGAASTSDVTITLPAETGTVLTTASSIANSNLANSSLTIGSTGIALGGSATTFTGLASITSTAVVTNDSGFRIRNNSDNSKILAFDLASISGGTTRTLTVPDATDTLALLAATQTFTNKTLTSAVLNGAISGTSIKDEDNMSSDSASHLATQQSIKAYVDAEVAGITGDITAVTAGTGLSGGGTSGAVTLNIDSTVATLTGSQTLTNKSLTSPAITGSLSGDAFLDEDNMASNSATKVASQQSIKAYVDTEIAGISADITAVNAGTGLSGGGSSGAVTLAIDATVATLTGSQTLTNKTLTSPTISNPSITGDISGTGNLILTSTDAGSSAAPEFELYRNSASPADADYLGQVKFTGESDDGSKEVYAKVTGKIDDASSGTEDGIIEFAHRKAGSNVITGRFKSTVFQLLNGTDLDVDGTITGNLTGNVTGNVSGSSGSTTGNAATATALQNARTIGGVSFDGTANINLPGVNTSGNQDTSGTAAIATTITVADESSDTSCNVLFTTAATGNLGPKSGTNLTFNSSSGVLTATGFAGALTGNVTGNVSGSSGSTTGNAATATALETARTIAGVSFDGTANISLNNNAITNGAGYLTSVGTSNITDDAVTYAKIQNVSATNRILGRDSSGAGAIEEITPANLRTMINVEDGADVTDATNVNAAGAVMNSDTSTSAMQFVVDEDNMSSDSATKVPTQQSVKAYVDSQAGGTEFADNVFRVKDNSDATKKLAFECSGISGSTTRTLTVPDSNGTIGTEDFATAIAVALG